MKVTVTGRHVGVSPETESHAEEKFARLNRYFSGIQRTDVVIGRVGHGAKQTVQVEATVTLGHGTKLIGKGQAGDVNGALDAAESKLEKQIRRFHARLKAHRDRSRISDENQTAEVESEATYDQVVREMWEEGEE